MSGGKPRRQTPSHSGGANRECSRTGAGVVVETFATTSIRCRTGGGSRLLVGIPKTSTANRHRPACAHFVKPSVDGDLRRRLTGIDRRRRSVRAIFTGPANAPLRPLTSTGPPDTGTQTSAAGIGRLESTRHENNAGITHQNAQCEALRGVDGGSSLRPTDNTARCQTTFKCAAYLNREPISEAYSGAIFWCH